MMEDMRQNTLEDVETDLKELQDARPNYDTYRRRMEELPKLKNEIKALATNKQDILDQCSRQDKLVSDADNAFSEIKMLEEPARDIVRYRNEIDSIAKKISDLESTMVELGGGGA